MLLLSWFGVAAGTGTRMRPERDFEDISQVAAESYFGRNEHDGSYLFAFPRRTKASGFPAAVGELARQLGEGGGAKPVKLAARQKDTLSSPTSGELPVTWWRAAAMSSCEWQARDSQQTAWFRV